MVLPRARVFMIIYKSTTTAFTSNDPAGQAGDPIDLRKVVDLEVFIAGGVEFWAELLPKICGLQQRGGVKAGVSGRGLGAVF